MPRGRKRQTPQDAKRDSETRILKALLDGPKTYTLLLTRTKLSEPTLTERLKGLEPKKISTKINPEDRRSKIYSIAPDGITQFRKERIFEEISQLSLKLDWPGRDKFGYSCVSGAFDSKLAKKWRRELFPKFKEYIKAGHPSINTKDLEMESDLLTKHFFDFLEANLRLNPFSSLKLKPIGVSSWSPLFGKVSKKDVYAEVWQRLYDIMLLLLRSVSDRYDDIEVFLKETQGKKIILVVGLDLENLYPTLKRHEKIMFAPKDELDKMFKEEIEPARTRGTSP